VVGVVAGSACDRSRLGKRQQGVAHNVQFLKEISYVLFQRLSVGHQVMDVVVGVFRTARYEHPRVESILYWTSRIGQDGASLGVGHCDMELIF